MISRERSFTALFLIAFFGLLTILSVVGFALGWRSDVASQEGTGIDSVLTYLLVVTGMILVAGHAVLCWFIWRNSAPEGPGAYERPGARREWAWGIVPVIVMSILSEAGVLAIASPVWKSLYIEKPADPLVVEVVGRQFEWLIRYPGKDGEFGRTLPKAVSAAEGNPLGLDEDDRAGDDDVIRRGELYLPKGRPVVIRLATHDVIHSFFCPPFRVKQDLIPGFGTRLKITPTAVGDYELACAELCGLGHYNMRGMVHVLEPDAFAKWLSEQRTFGG